MNQLIETCSAAFGALEDFSVGPLGAGGRGGGIPSEEDLHQQAGGVAPDRRHLRHAHRRHHERRSPHAVRRGPRGVAPTSGASQRRMCLSYGNRKLNQNRNSMLVMLHFVPDAAPRPKHVSDVEGVWRKGRVLQLEVERDEPDASQGFGGEAGGQAVASGVVSKETQLSDSIRLICYVQNRV